MADGFGQPIDPSLLGATDVAQVPAQEQAPTGAGPAPLQLWLQTIGAALLGASGKGTEALETLRKSRADQAAGGERAIIGQAVQAMNNLSRLEREGRLEEAEQLGLQWAATTSKVSPTLSVQFRQLADSIRDRRSKVRATEAAVTGIERAVAPTAAGPIPGVAELVPPQARPEVEAAIAGLGKQIPVESPQALLASVRGAMKPPGEQRVKLSADQVLMAREMFGREANFADELEGPQARAVLEREDRRFVERSTARAVETGQSRVYDPKLAEPVPAYDPEAVRKGQQVVVTNEDHGRLTVIRQLEPAVRSSLDLARRIMAVNPGENILRAAQAFVQRGLASSTELALFEALMGPTVLQATRMYQGSRPSDLDLQTALLAFPTIARDRVDTSVAKLEAFLEQLDNAKKANLGQPIPSRLESVTRRLAPAPIGGGLTFTPRGRP